MGRRIRIEYPGLTYHVFSRGNRRAAVFRSPAEYLWYLEDLRRLTERHGVAVLAFCLMPNHPHLCLRTSADGDALSVLMQRLNLKHARRYNAVHRTRGHLNESAYKAQVVDSERYLLALVRYIHQNPVRARMVARADDWPFSSQRAYLRQGFDWVQTEEVLARAGGHQGYARLMADPQAKPERSPFAADRKGRMPAIVSDLSLIGWRREKPGPWREQPPERAIEEAAREAAQETGWRLEELQGYQARRGAREARRGLVVALRSQGYRLHEIGRIVGREEAAISRLIERASGCAEREAAYQAA